MDRINPFSRSSRKEVALNLNVTQLFVVVVVVFSLRCCSCGVFSLRCCCGYGVCVCVHCVRVCVRVCVHVLSSYRVKNVFPYKMLIRYKLHKRSLKAVWLELI